MKGREHLNLENEEVGVLGSCGGRLVFSSGDSFFSSTDLIRSEVVNSRRLPVDLPAEFMKHHEISRDRLAECVTNLSKLLVLVVRDANVDEYVSCHPLGMFRGDPTLVVTPVESKGFVGGAAIVAAHATIFDGHAVLYGVTGPDSKATFLVDEFANLLR